MRLSRIATTALAGVWLTFVARGGSAEACQLQKVAELPVTMDHGLPLVDASLNGHPVRFLVSTSSSVSYLTREGAKKLGFKPVQVDRITIEGGVNDWVGSESNVGRVGIREFKIGASVLRDVDMVVSGQGGSDLYIGVLGRDELLLSGNDLELDLAHNVIRLVKPKDCQGDQVVYWSGSYFLVSIGGRQMYSSAIEINASLNGRPVSALFSTGASHSIVTPEAAQAAGVTPPSDGGGGTFQTLGVGAETIQNAQLEIAELTSLGERGSTGTILRRRSSGADMLLGADFAKAHHIYVAAHEGKVYFTYNGGQIFELPAAAAADAIAGHPSTVEGHLARGVALLNAGRYAEAVAEFDAVIALDPKSQSAWSERALAHAWLLDPAALADADRSDVLGPPTATAAHARGLYAANTGDVVGARTAFRRALTLSPNDAFSLRQLFLLDLQAGDLEAAVRDLERFKQVQPLGSALPRIYQIVLQHRRGREAEARQALDALEPGLRSAVDLNNACYELAVEGIFLERALADCDASLKLKPGEAATLDSRGFVLLRLGRNAEAIEAYNAALAAKPGQYNSMYGRGLAEARTGRADDAARDIKTALAALPYLRRTFEVMGVK